MEIPSNASKSNDSKYITDTNLLLIDDNMAKLHYQSLLIIDFTGKVPVHPRLSDSVIPILTQITATRTIMYIVVKIFILGIKY